MNACCDVAIDKAQPIIAACRRGLIGEAEVVEGAVQPIAGPVAGKDSSSSVSAMGRRRESNNQNSRSTGTKTGYRPAPVIPIAEPLYLFVRDRFAVFNQARAAAAIDNFILGGQPGHFE